MNTSVEHDKPADVSVIIPMLNAADTIELQLEALANQTLEDHVEILVIDNGSTDGSQESVRRWQHRLPHLRLYTASEKHSAGYARNVGTAAASADLLLYCDADDVVGEDWIASVVRNLRVFDVVGSRFDTVTLAEAGADASATDIQQSQPRLAQATTPSFLEWAGGSGCGLRREVIDAIGPWDDTGVIGEDVDLSWRAQLAGYVLAIPDDCVVFYRPPETLTELLRREFNAGVRAPLLYQRFREHGATRRESRHILRNVAQLIVKLPFTITGRARSREWLSQVAGQAGRVWGSIRHRTLFL